MKLSTLAIAALFAAALPMSTMAQDAAQAGNAAAGATASQQQGAYEDFDAFLQAFGSADFAAATESLSATEGTSTYTVMSLGTLANSDPARLQEALTAQSEELEALRAAVAANEEAVAALEDEGLTQEAVVWAESGENNTVILYVNSEGSQ